MAKILVVEDDNGLSALLAKGLKQSQHVVDLANCGEDALQLLDLFNYDLLILDWGLPGIQGDKVCTRYRKSGGKSPILFLTGRSDLNSIESALEQGADDYLTKPFAEEELNARVKALLRRTAPAHESSITVPGLSLCLNTHTAKVDGQEINLSAKEFELLKFLMENPNKHFSSKDLLKSVWPPNSATAEQTVRSTMHSLRKKISTSADDCIIKTTPKVGFIINIPKDDIQTS